MISSERQLERVLPHYTLESTRRATILSAVQRGVTSKPKYMRVAIEELEKAKEFGKASDLASRMGDASLSADLLKKQHAANIGSVKRKQSASKAFDELFSNITDPQVRNTAAIAAVKSGITLRLEHVRLAIAENELVGPGMVLESERFARSVGANTSQICEAEGWIGLAAHISQSEGENERTITLYERYVGILEDAEKFGLAAEISLYKLGDVDRAIANGMKAGSWEIVVELSRRRGDEQTAKVAGKLASMLRQ